MDSITYPTSTAGYRHQVVYEYSNGQPWKVRDFGNTVTYWQANAQDALGNITDETLGNGLRTTRSFDVVSGFPGFIRTGPGGGSSIQNLNYVFDLVGNLTSRNDAIQTVTEAFTYDDLYRLTNTTLNGASTLVASYNAYGNIASRSDVGTYTYHATKIHAVASTSNGWSYGYDANGNVTSKNGSAVSWYASNLPQTINNGASSSSFEYTPSGQYWRQVASGYSNGTETTTYIGGLLEIVQGPSITAYRHYIKVGGRTVAIYTRGSNGVIATTYPLVDHLGSTEAVADAAGVLIVRESFAAFGARRGSNWAGNPSATDMSAIANTSRRGFTDHTILDNIGLVHMNGRVFDPVIGRFLSADPFLDGGSGTQGFNRYSYVGNNPLSYTDPSGFQKAGSEREGVVSPTDEAASEHGNLAFWLKYGNGTIDGIPAMWNFGGAEWFQYNHMSGFTGINGPLNLTPMGSPTRQFGNTTQTWVRGGTTSVEGIDCVGGPCPSGPSAGYWQSGPTISVGSPFPSFFLPPTRSPASGASNTQSPKADTRCPRTNPNAGSSYLSRVQSSVRVTDAALSGGASSLLGRGAKILGTGALAQQFWGTTAMTPLRTWMSGGAPVATNFGTISGAGRLAASVGTSATAGAGLWLSWNGGTLGGAAFSEIPIPFSNGRTLRDGMAAFFMFELGPLGNEATELRCGW